MEGSVALCASRDGQQAFEATVDLVPMKWERALSAREPQHGKKSEQRAPLHTLRDIRLGRALFFSFLAGDVMLNVLKE